MAKEIKFDVDAREMLKKGVDQLANAVKVTLRLTKCHTLSVWHAFGIGRK